MSALYATGRLVWRPTILIVLFPLAVVLGLAFWDLPSSSHLGAAEYAELQKTFWQFATIVPASFGLLQSLLTRELQHTPFAWTLPDLSRKLLLGKAAGGAVVASVIAIASSYLADPGLSVAVFGWSCLSFAAGGIVFDPVRSKIESFGAGLIVAGLAFDGSTIQRLGEVQPYGMGALSLLGGVLLLAREFGQSLARLRPVTFLPPAWSSAPGALRQYWARQNTSGVEWDRSLVRGSMIDWILAGAHEAFGARKRGFVTAVSVQLAVTVVYCYLLGNVTMAVVFPWIAIGTSGLQLHTRLLYPLSRDERASLFFFSSLAEMLAVSAAGLVALSIVLAIGTRPGTETDARTFSDIAGLLALFVAFAPIGQWAKVRGSYATSPPNSSKLAFRFFAFQIAFVLLAMGIHFAVRNLEPGAELWIAGAALLATQTTFWLALRRHFATQDLIFSKA